ncbi:MAG: DNA-3-methyladenine glycosylase I [Planctomycetota bacterium]|jgi:DNA-3-methyladenine glycosylase I|nr:DNA-3-methyladenine glycosylase I [Planctomycetota bacterium]
MPKEKRRCPWCGDDPLYQRYHDEEWGVPMRDDKRLFEFLILEGAQAGLSWITILRKRENYRNAFAGFDPEKIARYGDEEKRELLANPGIVRNRLKIDAAIQNARAFLKTTERHGSFSRFLWDFVEGKPIRNAWRRLEDIPSSTCLSDRISGEMRRLGFKFAGSTIIYAHMQATGMVNDHLTSCFRYREVSGLCRM